MPFKITFDWDLCRTIKMTVDILAVGGRWGDSAEE